MTEFLFILYLGVIFVLVLPGGLNFKYMTENWHLLVAVQIGLSMSMYVNFLSKNGAEF